jgi:hypothetical protein
VLLHVREPDALPNIACGSLDLLEALDRLHSGQAVPNRDQAFGGPIGREAIQFLRGCEELKLSVGSGDFLVGREGGDVVVSIDGERRDFVISFAAALRPCSIHHSGRGHMQAESDRNVLGREGGSDDSRGAGTAASKHHDPKIRPPVCPLSWFRFAFGFPIPAPTNFSDFRQVAIVFSPRIACFGEVLAYVALVP